MSSRQIQRTKQPQQWQLVTLEDIAASTKHSIKRGPWGGSLKREIFVSSGYKVYEQKNVIYNDFKIGNYYIDSQKFSELKDFAISPGDVLISCSGTYGKVAVVPNNIEKGIINQALLKISPNQEKIVTPYFKYLLESELIQKYFVGLTHGSAIKNVVSVSILKQMKFRLPSIFEQHKIASTLSKVDELIQKTDQIIEQTQRLKKALMQRLLTKGIGHAKFKKVSWLFGKKIVIPEEWNILSLHDICKNITDGKHGDCENENHSGFYFISAKDIFNGKIHYEKARQITMSDFLDAHKRTKIEPGDILLTNSGSIGKLAIVEDKFNTPKTTFQKSVAILKPSIDKIFVKFFYYYLDYNQQQLETIASGSSQKNLLLRQLESFRIVLPLLSEQKKIGLVLSDIDSRIQNQKDHKLIFENLKKGLMQKLLTGKIRVKV